MKKLTILSLILVVLLTGCKSEDNEDVSLPDNPSDNIEDSVDKDYDDSELWDTDTSEDNNINTDNELKESNIYGYAYDEDGYLVKVIPDTAGNMDGSIEEIESVYDDFRGELVKDYSKEDKKPSATFNNKTLVSANEYTGTVDIDANSQDWDTLYNNLTSKPDDYNGKVIKVIGVGYVNNNIGNIRVGNSHNLIDYIAATYPTSGSNIQVIGIITYNNDNSLVIDAEEVDIVY